MRFDTLPEWLDWQEKLHFTEVDPGLERIGQVWQRLNVTLSFKIITVAGTNGKGSSVAMLDSILHVAGYKTGRYTSPHLLRYNERIVVAGNACSDQELCEAFEKIDAARGAISLTYFEFATLAAILLFHQHQVDIAILEVGMGGRLDAVNLFDADIALITAISLDHTQWLGQDRETIAFEKAGVIRQNQPVICSEALPAKSLLAHAESLQAPTFIAHQHFHYEISETEWHWSNAEHQWHSLNFPALSGQYQIQNAAAVLQVLSILIKQGLTINKAQIDQGLTTVILAARFQKIAGPVNQYFDVTHNIQGATNLASLLAATPCEGLTFAVLGMLKDKKAYDVAKILSPRVDAWYLGGLSLGRGLSGEALAAQVEQGIVDDKPIVAYDSVLEAYNMAMKEAKPGDRILVFGSFHTVAAVMLANAQ
ncbi:UNVERIFIED_CONTAM: hypothetical protein GTU68_026827 [Idotea baltica]|nr:hypothetical protein [Idotea baltica]